MLSVPFPTVSNVVFRIKIIRREIALNCCYSFGLFSIHDYDEYGSGDVNISAPSEHSIVEEYAKQGFAHNKKCRDSLHPTALENKAIGKVIDVLVQSELKYMKSVIDMKHSLEENGLLHDKDCERVDTDGEMDAKGRISKDSSIKSWKKRGLNGKRK